MIDKTQLKHFYLLTFPPLILFSLILILVDSNIINLALFIFGYTFGLVSRAPGVDHVIGQKKYRFSFLRLCYQLTNFVLFKMNAHHKLSLSMVVRSLLPCVLIAAVMFLFQVRLNIHFTLAGAVICEMVMMLLRRYIPKNILAFN